MVKSKEIKEFIWELRHFRYFVAVAETLNFSRAAERLNIQQPPLSYQIKQLETELESQLFERKRPLILTEAGQHFLEEARLILAAVERAIESTLLVSQGKKGKLTVGFNSSVSNSILPEIIKSFRASLPDVKLILQEHPAYRLIEALSTQQVDIGLMHWSASYHLDKSLARELIQEESLVLVLPENHPLVNESEISIKSLANESFILPPSHISYSLAEPIAHFWQQIEFIPKETQEATLMLTILNLVAGGVGVALLPANVKNIQRKGVVYKPLQEATPILQIVAVWRDDNLSPVLKRFLEVTKIVGAKK